MLPHRGSSYLALAILCAGLTHTFAGSVRADQQASESPTEETAEPRPTHSPFDLSGKYMMGDWGGARTDLEEMGVRFTIKLMNQLMVNMHGGLETRNGHDTGGTYEIDIFLDFEKMGLIDDAEFWIRAKGAWGGEVTDFDTEKIGAFFRTNQDVGIEESIFVDKWHWRQRFFDDTLEFRFGRQEPVKDLFDRSKVMGHEDKYFLNRALVRNATIPAKKGLGFFLNWNITDHLYARAAALDALSEPRQTNFNTAFHEEDWYRFFAEIGCKPEFDSGNRKLWGHYRIGTWYDPLPKQKFFNTLGGLRTERIDRGDWGFFVGFDQMVWKENDCAKDNQGIVIAGRYGFAHSEYNIVEHFWALAAHYEGLIPSRKYDRLGVGIAQAIFSNEYRGIWDGPDNETVTEAYYNIHVAPWLVISPHLQYISNDNDAFVAALRIKMLF